MICLMDSSVRDGGNLNEWHFGEKVISGIVRDLEYAKIDYIELGYLKDCESNKDKSLFNYVSEAEKYIGTDSESEYSLMVQEDKWTWNKLEPCAGKINNIRVSFHKTDIKEGLELCRLVMEQGYKCHCNPINIMGYSDEELIDLINLINDVAPYSFTVVDTFGSMMIDDMKRVCSILHHNLKPEITIASHLHDNIGLAFALAIEFMDFFESKRDVIVDATLYGIGRIPGNLCLENVAIHCNREKRKRYKINYIYDAIDDYISSIKREHPWGYELAYAMQAFYNVHRTYPEYLLNKGKLKSKEIGKILSEIPREESVIYNERYIEKKYYGYMCRSIDDTLFCRKLNDAIGDKKVVILAPGSSLKFKKQQVVDEISDGSSFIISVNFLPDFVDPDCVFVNSTKRYSQIQHIPNNTLLALSSNIKFDTSDSELIFDYERLTKHGTSICEDGVIMLLTLLLQMAPFKKYTIAGFDALCKSSEHIDKSMDLGLAKKDYEIISNLMEDYIRDYSIQII